LGDGTEVLDLACGHGRIANRLAGMGAQLTGLDATPIVLDLARADADRRGVSVDYVQGRSNSQWTIIRNGRMRHSSFFARLFSFTELRDSLLDAGFRTARGTRVTTAR
jgi:Methyltransferase domain